MKLKKRIREESRQELKMLKIKKSKFNILLKLLLPWALSFLVIFGLWLSGTDIYLKFMYLAGVYLFTPVGMIAGLPFALKIGLSTTNSIVFMIFMDAMASLWIIWNLDLLRIIPGLGILIKRCENWSENYIKKREKIRTYGFIAVILFVLIPVYGSGSILGSIIGKLLSLKNHRILIAVLTGVTLRLIIFGLFAEGVMFFI